jgi:hypothetical protein
MLLRLLHAGSGVTGGSEAGKHLPNDHQTGSSAWWYDDWKAVKEKVAATPGQRKKPKEKSPGEQPGLQGKGD